MTFSLILFLAVWSNLVRNLSHWNVEDHLNVEFQSQMTHLSPATCDKVCVTKNLSPWWWPGFAASLCRWATRMGDYAPALSTTGPLASVCNTSGWSAPPTPASVAASTQWCGFCLSTFSSRYKSQFEILVTLSNFVSLSSLAKFSELMWRVHQVCLSSTLLIDQAQKRF